jgi:hypothetical protein
MLQPTFGLCFQIFFSWSSPSRIQPRQTSHFSSVFPKNSKTSHFSIVFARAPASLASSFPDSVIGVFFCVAAPLISLRRSPVHQ